MDQISRIPQSTAASLKASRIAKNYSLEDLAIATGLTVSEISVAEDELGTAPSSHVERIKHALA